jgi:hypothetical protein
MRSTTSLFAMAVILAIGSNGCRSHESRVADLQKQYDQLGAQYQKDCSAEYLKVPPTLSPKCSDELKQLDAMSKRLQDERAKK